MDKARVAQQTRRFNPTGADLELKAALLVQALEGLMKVEAGKVEDPEAWLAIYMLAVEIRVGTRRLAL